MSPFPQSVAYSSESPAMFRLLRLFRWSLFNSLFRSISNGHAGSVDKVSLIRLVWRCPMSKSVLLSYIIIADDTKREVKNR